jgi:hypothetical protein
MKNSLVPFPTFSEFRDILIRDFGCQLAPPVRNLANSPKRLALITRMIDESELEWLVYLDDRDRITGEIALYACRCLEIPPEQVELPDPEPMK